MKTVKLLFLLPLAVICSGVFAQSNRPEQTVATSIHLEKDTIAILSLLALGNTQLELGGEISQAISYAIKADSLSTLISYKKGLGESALLMVGCLKRLFKYEDAAPLLKKAEAIFEKLHSEDGLIRTYSFMGAMDRDVSVRESSYEKVLSLLKARGDKRGVAAILTGYSEVKMLQAQLPDAEDMLKESIRLSNELGIEQIQWQYGLLGAIQIQMRNSVEALKNELFAIKLGEQHGDTTSRMAEIYNYAAIIYNKMGKLDESSQYLRKAIGTGTYSQDPMLSIQFLSNLASILIRQNKPQEAIDILLILEKKYGNDMPDIGQMLSRFVRCYVALNDLPSASRYAEQLIGCSDSMKPDDYKQLAIYNELNRYLIASGQYERAKRFVEQQRNVANKFKLPDQRTSSYFYQFKIDSAFGDMASALHSYQLYAKGLDSVSNENTNKQLNQLHVEFETEKKDKELQLKEKNIQLLVQESALQKALFDKNAQALALKQKDLLNEQQHVELLTKQKQLQEADNEKQERELLMKQKDITLLTQSNNIQEAELTRAGILRNIIIAGALSLVVISILIYSRYKTKKRTSEELSLQREEIRRKNLSLEALIGDKDKLLEEKEWLVKEVHHRVKNNLQMVISLLNSQSAFLSSQDAISAIQESQRRMHAISLIHQRLYEKTGATINMQSYIVDLVNYFKESFDCSAVQFVLDVEPVMLDVSQAVAVGLILNEAITNSLKYAFPESRTGHISVSFKLVSAYLELAIEDDGIGFPENKNPQPKKSLGMNLLKGLTGQIGGSCEIRSEGGVEIIIKFPPAEIKKGVPQVAFAETRML